MPLVVEEMIQSGELGKRWVFLSGSIPDPQRYTRPFDAFEITDAVVAVARSVFTSSGRLVCAVHPTIAPLLLSVGAEFPIQSTDDPLLLVYQSQYFATALVAETRQLERTPGLGRIVWTPAAEVPDERQRLEGSLNIMRRRMLEETDPIAAVFVGGMDGVAEEFDLFTSLYPGRGVYPFAAPGGAAASLADRVESPLRHELATSRLYPYVMTLVVQDIVRAL